MRISCFQPGRVLGAAMLVLLAASAGWAQQRPNIVFVISDDHDYEHLGFMGNRLVHTPTLDRLAAAGTVFTTAHLPMSRCHPTLASFMSGQWPHQSGIYYNYGDKQLSPKNSLPNLLKDAGYATYVEGKYWEGDPRAMGFTHGAGKTARTFVRKGQDALFDFIDDQAGKSPMFIWWAPLIPHTPHNPPPRHVEKFAGKQIPIPDYVQGKANRKQFVAKERKSLAMEAWLDEGTAQLEKKLKDAGVSDNTLWVFVIDNGWCNGLVSKGSPFEKGVRTPVFFSWPEKIKAGQRFDGLISTLDLYPTILDYAGIECPRSAAGNNLRPQIEGQGSAARDVLFGAIYPAFATKNDQRPERDVYALYARTDKWKYILYLQNVVQKRNGSYFRIQSICTDYPTRQAGDEDLFDLASDPHELQDLADQEETRSVRQQMRKQVLAWWKETGGKPLEVPTAE